MSTDHRRDQRYPLDVECTIFAGDLKLRARTRNVSRSGIAFKVPEELILGVEVLVEMALAFGDEEYSEPIQIPATIVWCTKLGSDWQIGARFAETPRELTRLLDVFIRFLEGGER